MPKTIVVPLDGSPFAARALRPAAALATQFDARLRLVTTTGHEDACSSTSLDELAARLDVPAFEHVAVDADPVTAITRVATEAPDSVVCMSTHGTRTAGLTVLGSVAEAVVGAGVAPVVLLGANASGCDGPAAGSGDGADDLFEALVVPLDGSPVAASILTLASAWGRELDIGIVLVTVVGTDDHTRLETVEQERLTEAVSRLKRDGLRVQARVLQHDFTARGIANLTETVRHPLVALATHGRSGLPRVALGSVAMDVVQRVGCPVLVAKPRLPGS